MDSQALIEMRQSLAAAIQKGCQEFGLDPLDRLQPFKLAVVGNTVMLCIFAGEAFEATLAPANWTRPILPELREDDPFWKEALPAIEMELFAPVGGFVGSDLMGGDIDVSSSQQGSTFRVSLPLKLAIGSS